ncbi:MAG: 4-hydroxy-tetrahydrodipicolinate reductase [Spirochaetes bacterium]|nr:4-hydroxy-tetrahydrodipicolinate reductase [Spirochaetota bacterium]
MIIGVCGIGGRMGRAVARVLAERGHLLGGAFEGEGSPFLAKDVSGVAEGAPPDMKITTVAGGDYGSLEGLIDFSSPAGSMALLERAVAHKTPLVIGTTGLSEADRRAIETAAGTIPVVFSPNMSVGVNLLFKLVELAARSIPAGYDIEIFEAHHRFKKDAPSGTAKRLMEIVNESSRLEGVGTPVYGREGITGERTGREIGMMAMRGGDIVGEHTVYFCGEGERIELTHRAQSRENLARGAVIAMEFTAGKGPGLYTMFDVLGFA